MTSLSNYEFVNCRNSAAPNLFLSSPFLPKQLRVQGKVEQQRGEHNQAENHMCIIYIFAWNAEDHTPLHEEHHQSCDHGADDRHQQNGGDDGFPFVSAHTLSISSISRKLLEFQLQHIVCEPLSEIVF